MKRNFQPIVMLIIGIPSLFGIVTLAGTLWWLYQVRLAAQSSTSEVAQVTPVFDFSPLYEKQETLFTASGLSAEGCFSGTYDTFTSSKIGSESSFSNEYGFYSLANKWDVSQRFNAGATITKDGYLSMFTMPRMAGNYPGKDTYIHFYSKSLFAGSKTVEAKNIKIAGLGTKQGRYFNLVSQEFTKSSSGYTFAKFTHFAVIEAVTTNQGQGFWLTFGTNDETSGKSVMRFYNREGTAFNEYKPQLFLKGKPRELNIRYERIIKSTSGPSNLSANNWPDVVNYYVSGINADGSRINEQKLATIRIETKFKDAQYSKIGLHLTTTYYENLSESTLYGSEVQVNQIDVKSCL